MAKPLSRRKLLKAGLATAAGVSAAGTAYLAGKNGLIPPDHGGIYGVGETLTYASERLLMSRHSLAREFDRSQISKIFPINGDPPGDPTYRRLRSRAFLDWRLMVNGLVAHPAQFSLADLMSYPSRSQITEQACEEGWSSIAEWTGVPLSHVLNLVGVHPRAKYVVYFSFQDDWWDSIDMAEAMHPQTLLAYGMNSQPLSVDHGAPVRMRVPRQLGYKSVKYLARITVADSLKSFGKGLGSASPEGGYSWFAGI